jgi:hypothetical protein
MDKKQSRASDPTYRPTKTFQQIWEEAGRPNNGLKMMAERERVLCSDSFAAEAQANEIRRDSAPVATSDYADLCPGAAFVK